MVSDIPAGVGKIDNLLLQCILVQVESRAAWAEPAQTDEEARCTSFLQVRPTLLKRLAIFLSPAEMSLTFFYSVEAVKEEAHHFLLKYYEGPTPPVLLEQLSLRPNS